MSPYSCVLNEPLVKSLAQLIKRVKFHKRITTNNYVTWYLRFLLHPILFPDSSLFFLLKLTPRAPSSHLLLATGNLPMLRKFFNFTGANDRVTIKKYISIHRENFMAIFTTLSVVIRCFTGLWGFLPHLSMFLLCVW